MQVNISKGRARRNKNESPGESEGERKVCNARRNRERQQHEKGSSETDPFVSLDAFTCFFSRLSKKPKERRGDEKSITWRKNEKH